MMEAVPDTINSLSSGDTANELNSNPNTYIEPLYIKTKINIPSIILVIGRCKSLWNIADRFISYGFGELTIMKAMGYFDY